MEIPKKRTKKTKKQKTKPQKFGPGNFTTVELWCTFREQIRLSVLPFWKNRLFTTLEVSWMARNNIKFIWRSCAILPRGTDGYQVGLIGKKQKKQNKTKNKTYKQVEAICVHERGKVKLVLIDGRNFPDIFRWIGWEKRKTVSLVWWNCSRAKRCKI